MPQRPATDAFRCPLPRLQSQATALEQFEIIPLGAMQRPRFVGLHLGDDLAKNLPAERVYETDGVCRPCIGGCAKCESALPGRAAVPFSRVTAADLTV
jgi:hypothetical protein